MARLATLFFVFAAAACGVHGQETCANEEDGNLEIEYPPLLDEANTHVIFDAQGVANFEITILVPKQYDVGTQMWFDGAQDTSGGYDSYDLGANVYWTSDNVTDACNVIYTGVMPWNLFRTSLGNVQVTDFTFEEVYSTQIVFRTQKSLTLTPETLLELKDKDMASLGLTQIAPIEYVRNVTTRIPFEISFDTQLTLSDTELVVVPLVLDPDVPGSNLRITPALLESSIISVDPSATLGSGTYLAVGHLYLVTNMPLPLILVEANIIVSEPSLSSNLTVTESLAARDCDATDAFCTQFWDIDIYPLACTITGQYNVSVRAECHPDTTNCEVPEYDTRVITLDVVSDSFCGITQSVTVQGALTLNPTECNDVLTGTVAVQTNSGAAINRTEIIEVIASPTLAGAASVLVYDEGLTSVLSYGATAVSPTEVDFSFEWLGSSLRCDVVATVEVTVRVVYDATRDLSLLDDADADESSKLTTKLLSFGGNSGDRKLHKLQQTGDDDGDDETVRVLEQVSVSASPDGSGGNSLTDGDGNGDELSGAGAVRVGDVSACVLRLLLIASVSIAFAS